MYEISWNKLLSLADTNANPIKRVAYLIFEISLNIMLSLFSSVLKKRYEMAQGLF